ncbi:MAG: DUF58 domain-containing protein [Armatimonadetes bacterium]|nr:DUF58 domain-containing protein [Armatimonadota bacterium]
MTVQARVPPLRRGARATVEVDFTVPWRGAWLLENFHLEGSDPLGLYVRRQNLQQAGGFIASPAYWTDLPVPWERLLAPGTRLRMAAERVEPTEYRAVRDYVPGDDIRHIHWPASAHRSKLQVKIYDRRREVQVQIWLAPVAEGRAANEGAEVAISVAATLARIFALAPLATVVRAPGLPLSAQGPGSGEGFWLQVLAMLAELPYCGLDAIEAAASDWAHGTRAGGTIYLVSNSASALRVLTSAVPRYCYPIRIATSRSAAVRGARVISSFSSIPMRLAALSRALQKAGTVAYGGR